MRENFSNFATTALVSPNPLTSGGLSFVCTTNQGVFFPASNFLVSIDGEILLISVRVNDTFTVAQRGYDGTTAASHTAGATIQVAVCNYTLTHLWQNVADTWRPEAPPLHGGYTPSSWDNEFETSGVNGWTLYPSSSGSIWGVSPTQGGITFRSLLVFDRAANDNGDYYAYTAFPGCGSGIPYLVTAKLSMSTSLDLASPGSLYQAQADLFVSDQANPTASVDAGTRFKVNVLLGVATSGNQVVASDCLVRAATDISSGFAQVGPSLPVSPGLPLYIRMRFNGISSWTAYYSGDGLIYWPLATKSSFAFTPASMGLTFHTIRPGSSWMAQNVVVDYVRVSVNNGYGTLGF